MCSLLLSPAGLVTIRADKSLYTTGVVQIKMRQLIIQKTEIGEVVVTLND